MRIDPRTHTLVREGVPAILNPDDLHAVEEAVRLKERLGGRVTVLSMGPPQAEASLRRALSLGADRAVLASDRAFAAADTYATTFVLARALRRLEREQGAPFDLVLCGRQALDGDTGQVGPGLAARLGLPLLGYVAAIREIDPAAGRIVVERALDRRREVIRSRLPALLTVDRALNTVRYASLPSLLASLEAPLTVWSASDLGADPEDVGLRGSPTRVVRSFSPPIRRRETRLFPGAAENPRHAAAQLADALLATGALAGGPAPAAGAPERPAPGAPSPVTAARV